jgi:hemerythrin-like metal-binding protein
MRRPTLQLTWNEGMSVGISEIDEDHQRFILLINKLNCSITTGKTPSEIKQIMQLIIDDAVHHFANEEVLISKWQYPDAEAHADIHVEVVRALEELQKQFIPYGNDSDWMDAGMKIKNILVDHIMKEDMKFADFYSNAERTINRDHFDNMSELLALPNNDPVRNSIEERLVKLEEEYRSQIRAMENELAHYRSHLEKLVLQRTERLNVRNSILESSNAYLSEKYFKMSQKYYAYLAVTTRPVNTRYKHKGIAIHYSTWRQGQEE